MYFKHVVKYNIPYLYLPNVFSMTKIDMFSTNVTPLHVQVKAEQFIYLTVSCEQH